MNFLEKGTLRCRITEFLESALESERFTNADIARHLSAPEASVRRMTLDLLGRGDIMTDGSPKLPYIYWAVPSLAPARL